MTLRTRIREYRSRAGLTQEQLAAATRVRRETIVFLESGRYNPSLRLAMAIAQELGATVEELFSFEE